MKQRDLTEQRLEELAGRVLRQQPLRQAPASLEARVLAEIDRRAHRPWWRQGVSAWPPAGRAVLVGISLSSIALLWFASPLLWMRLVAAAGHARLMGPIAAIGQFGHALISLAGIAAAIANAIPRDWLLGGIMAAGALYCALFALIYLLLYLSPRHSKARPL